MIDAVNACTPKPSPLAKYTLFDGLGHNIWDKVYKQTNALDWMLSFTNGSTSVSDGGTTANTAPAVSAGSDKSLTLPDREIYLQGSASDSDGSIVSYKWSKVSGPAASLGAYTTSKLRAYNLVEGSYTFRLTVKDDKGAYKSDDAKVTVSASSATNVAPVARAGADKKTSATSVTISGSGSDEDGNIVSYKWEKYYGGTVTLTNSNTPSVTVSGMKDGKYFLRLTVTDNDGATDYDNMQIVVSGSSSGTSTGDAPSTTTNITPVANAGSDIQTSSTSLTLSGSGTDKDGQIVSYKWIQYGGAAATLTNSTSRNASVSGLRDGKYYFRLTVTDDRGATDYDNMLINVSKSTSTTSNISPVSNAGYDKRITDNISALKLYGSGTDKDGEIISYKWTQYGGEDVTLRNASSPTVTVSDLDPGRYYLRLTVKDDDGAVDHDNLLIVVNES